MPAVNMGSVGGHEQLLVIILALSLLAVIKGLLQPQREVSLRPIGMLSDQLTNKTNRYRQTSTILATGMYEW